MVCASIIRWLDILPIILTMPCSYCGNSFASGAVLATGGSDPNSNGCSMTCAGNATQYCGGPNRLNAYRTNGNLPSSATTTANTSTPTPTGPVTVGNFTGWNYLGCYSQATNQRALTGNTVTGNSISVQSCATSCAGFTYFGVEYSSEW